MIKLFHKSKDAHYELEEQVNSFIEAQKLAGFEVTVSSFGGDYSTTVCVFSTPSATPTEPNLNGGVETKPEDTSTFQG